jgi:hypothetical protein
MNGLTNVTREWFCYKEQLSDTTALSCRVMPLTAQQESFHQMLSRSWHHAPGLGLQNHERK